MSDKLHVVIGSGQVGTHLVRALHADGTPTRAVTRGGPTVPTGVEAVTADVSESTGAARAVEGAAVVYLCVGAPYSQWAQVLPTVQRTVLDAVAGIGAKLVVLENMYAYGPTAGAPLREDLPLTATEGKGAVRRRMAEDLRAAHDSGRVRTTSVRAADFFGPGVGYGPAADLFRNAVRGEPVVFPFSADQQHSLSYLPDVALAMMILGNSDRADGRPWHVPNPPAHTLRDLVDDVAKLTGRTVPVQVLPEEVLEGLRATDADVRELWEIRHFYRDPYLVDHSAFAAEFGDISTPWEQAVRDTVSWYESGKH